MTIGDALTDAIRYWEIRRLLYNGILAIVVVAVFLMEWPASRSAVSVELAQGLFVLAVLANVAYCAAYLVDLAAQFSDFRPSWIRHRWVLLAIGTVFAAIIARFITAGMFGNAA